MTYIYSIWGVADQLSKKLVIIGYGIFVLVNGHIFISSMDHFFQSIFTYNSYGYFSIFSFIPLTFAFYSFSIGLMIRFLNLILNFLKK